MGRAKLAFRGSGEAAVELSAINRLLIKLAPYCEGVRADVREIEMLLGSFAFRGCASEASSIIIKELIKPVYCICESNAVWR